MQLLINVFADNVIVMYHHKKKLFPVYLPEGIGKGVHFCQVIWNFVLAILIHAYSG